MSPTPRGTRDLIHRLASHGALATFILALAVTHSGYAQQDTPAADSAPETRDPSSQPLSAKVIDVRGAAEWAAVGVSVLVSDGWTPLKLDDVLQAGTQIRTGLRSHVNLQFGTTTIVGIRSATHAGIDQLYRSVNTEVIRLGLGYGTVRGGSSEGEMRSDFTVDSTVATLAKRGTEGWQMTVEPGTGRFRISLAEYGLVEAIRKLGRGLRTTRSVRPGEYATDANIANMWIKQDIFDRNVKFYEVQGLTAADVEFSQANARGLATVAPGGGTSVVDLSQRVNASFVLDQLAANAPPGSTGPNLVVIEPGVLQRPEGNFGTGSIFRVLVPQRTRGLGQKPIVPGARPGR